MRRFLVSVVALLAVILLFVVVVPFFVPWSPLNCWHEDVDITTGRIRTQWFLLFVKVSESVKETPLSEVVLGGPRSAAAPQWHRVNTFSPGLRYSPHYRYHAAGHQIWELSELWQLPAPKDCPPELREITARHVLALWQEGSDERAGDYVAQLYESLDSEDRDALIKTLSGIRMPKYESVGNRTVKTLYFPNGRPLERFEGVLTDEGDFVADGIWEMWYPNGQRRVYGHFREGRHDGRRFEWDRDGRLIAIAGYRDNELTEYVAESLDRHPDFTKAMELTRP
jgi:hypothetical protein